MAEEKRNASQYPCIFFCRHMQPGICGYDKETVLVDTDAIKRMIPTGVGKPVYIHHQDVELKDMKERAAGYVTESFYNELDGWAWFKFLAIDDECHQAVTNGWAVSNAYIPSEWGAAGTKNNCPYNREVLNGEFTHLAVVPEPRYEGARIFSTEEFKAYQETKKRQLDELQNSNLKKGKTMFKLFKNTRAEVSEVDEDTMVELQNGKSVSVKEMLNAVKKNAEEDEKKKKEMDNSDQMIECGGEKMPLKELINRFEKLSAKKNAEDEDGDEDEEKAKKEKKNKAKKNADSDDGRKKKEDDADEDDHEDEIDDEKEKKNANDKNDAKHFEELRNAHLKANEPVQQIETSMDKLARGRERYSL